MTFYRKGFASMGAKPLNNRDTAYLCRSLAGLLHAGISSGEACYLLLQEEQGAAENVLRELGVLLDEGIPLGEALLECRDFPSATAGLIRTGDHTGRTEEALLSAAGFHEARDRTQQQLRNALGYPLFLLALMMTVVGVLLIQVLPVFDSVYASLGSRLTGMAAGLLHLGQVLKGALPVLFAVLGMLLAGAGLYRFLPPFRSAATRMVKKCTDDRWILRDFNNARFVQALSMGIGSGLTPEESVSLASSLLQESPAAASRCQQCLQLLQSGSDLSDALGRFSLMPAYACRMLSAGLRGGNADRILEDIARRMQEDAEKKLEDSLSRIEPAMVLLCSVLVGMILLSVMLPLLDIMSALG